MNSFFEVEMRFVKLCELFDVPVPWIRPSLETDPCDFTSAEEVRLNVVAAGDIDIDYYARHVFGHYLCDLHCYGEGQADKVADRIELLVRLGVAAVKVYRSLPETWKEVWKSPAK